MSTDSLIGREKEKSILNQIVTSNKSEFLALYGRRRIGKTYLIKQFFSEKNHLFFYCSGLRNGSLSQHLDLFSKQLGLCFYNGAPLQSSDSWLKAFEQLNKAIEQIPRNKKLIIFLDELPWMATPRSGLLDALDHYWNRYWSHDKRFKLIVCGSSASWIIDNIINNVDGLYNRVTRTMTLDPFSLNETQRYLKSQKINLNQEQVLELYLALGGIPHYLALLKKGLSAAQCIDELCFQRGGALSMEFDRLFASLFRDPEPYINLIKTIAKHRYGIMQAQLVKESGATAGGSTSKKLKELEEAGFILSFTPYNHSDKGIYYKVIDEFTLFYLKWMAGKNKGLSKQEQKEGYWLSKTKSPSYQAWSGYAFEAVCYKHIKQIRKALKIEAGAEAGSWRYNPKSKEQQGAQIDLLFDREDGVISVCEIKYNNKPFSIDKSYASNLTNKLHAFSKHTRSKKQLFLNMVTVNGVKPSIYSEELICGVVKLGDFFKV